MSYTVHFTGDYTSEPMVAFDDTALDLARSAVEKRLGRKLPIDPRTNYPSFTVYNAAGDEVGGG